MDFFKLLNGFVKIDTWISPSYYLDMPKLLHGFVKVVTWIFHNWYIWIFPKLLHGSVKIDTWISLCCYRDLPKLFMDFLKLLRGFLLKLLPWTKGVEWVKVPNALGLLCLWQCLLIKRYFSCSNTVAPVSTMSRCCTGTFPGQAHSVE